MSYIILPLYTSRVSETEYGIIDLVNVVVNLLLIPHYGAVGSACASLAAQSLMAVTQMILSVRLFRLPVAIFRLPRPSDFRRVVSILRENNKN